MATTSFCPIAARLSVLLLYALSLASSQPLRLRFDHITTRDGLSQDIVTAIVQDAHGFMWFGTEDGLNRYDGYEVRRYTNDPFDSTSLAGNSIVALFVDSGGRLWVSANGLNLYDERIDGFMRIRHDPTDPTSLPDNHVPAVCQDGNGAIWAGTDQGLARLDAATGRWTCYRHDPSNRSTLSADIVRALLVDGGRNLWVGTEKGLDRYDPSDDSFQRSVLRRNVGEDVAVNSILEDSNGMIWLGTRGRGLIRFDPRMGRTTEFVHDNRGRNSLGDDLVFAVASDQRGRLWIGHFGGLDLFDPSTGTFDHYIRSPDDLDALIGSRAYTIYPDRSGAVWVGTYHGGVERYDPYRQKFNLIRPMRGSIRGLPDENVLAVLEDASGRVWVGTQAGLAVSQPSFGRLVPDGFTGQRPLNVDRTAVLALLEDSRRTVWIGYDRPGMLVRVDRAGKTVDRIACPGVRTMREDRKGDLWLGMQSDGLARYTPSTRRLTWFRNRPESTDSLWGEGVWSIFEDSKGFLWVGTGGTNECLNRFDRSTGRFTHFGDRANDTASFPGGSVRAIVEDSHGMLWFGHWGAGLTRYDPATRGFTRFTQEDGLPSNYVKAILADAQDNLWIGTERGMARFTPATETFRTYSTEDGLQGDRFYSGAAFRGNSGYMYFGGEHGLNVFRPDEIRDNVTPPPVRLTSFKVFDEPVELPDAIGNLSQVELSYRQDFISFEFVALDYSSPARNRYAFMMDGLNPNWIDAGDRRYAAFTHLDPGTYTFRVKAANADGIWNDEGATIRVVIEPPFWETVWFRVLVILTTGAGLYLVYRMRIARLLAVERLRQRIAQDLHDEIGTNLSTIVLASRSLKGGRGLRKDARVSLDRIGTVAQRTTDQMKDIVWVLKTGNDSLAHLVMKMREVAGQLLIGTRYRFEAPSEALLDKVGLEFKRNIFLFYKECVNNIARHAKATDVVIRVGHANAVFTLQVEDNGVGFSGNESPTGSGLQNLRARAQLLGGAVDIATAPGKGTRITLTVKTTQMRHSFLGRGSVG